jgi:hypothetical protein
MPKEPKALENADDPVYVTQGTVQIERLTETKAEIFINPASDYAVKHNEEDYIVFVGAGFPRLESRLFDRKKKSFTVQQGYFIEMLTKAAFARTKIEIKMDAGCTKIMALKIPAVP